MNIYFDTEFTGLKKKTTLVSIGLISDDGRTFYAELTDYDKSYTDEWFKENVETNLLYKKSDMHLESVVIDSDMSNFRVRGIKDFVRIYLDKWLSTFDKVQLVSDVCHYDMVLFIDIFNNAFDIPKNVCPWCHDINQDMCIYFNMDGDASFNLQRESLIDEMTYLMPETYQIDGEKHNALYDAKVIRALYYIIQKVKEEQVNTDI